MLELVRKCSNQPIEAMVPGTLIFDFKERHHEQREFTPLSV